MKKLRIKELDDGSKPINDLIAEMVAKVEAEGYTPNLSSFDFDITVDVEELRGDDQVFKQTTRVLVRGSVMSYEED